MFRTLKLHGLVLICVALAAMQHAATGMPQSQEKERAEYDAFWAQQRAKADSQGPDFVTDELRREIEGRRQNLQRMRYVVAQRAPDEQAREQAWFDSEEALIAGLEARKGELDQARRSEYQRRKEARDSARAEKIIQQENNTEAFVRKVANEVAEDNRKQEAADLKEAAAARARQKQKEDWARDNCGPMPPNIPAAVITYLRKYAHNPDSVRLQDCETPSFTTKCWAVTCTYRANNRLGAINLYVQDFYLGEGKISGGKVH